MELLFWCYTSIHESSLFNKTFSCVHDPSEPLNRIQNVWYVSASSHSVMIIASSCFCVLRFCQLCDTILTANVGYTRLCQLAQWRYSCNLFLKYYIRVLCLCQLISDKILLSEYDESVKCLNFMSWCNLNRVSCQRLDHLRLTKIFRYRLLLAESQERGFENL